MHGKESDRLSIIPLSASTWLHEFQKAKFPLHVRDVCRPTKKIRWLPPDRGKLKLNTDAVIPRFSIGTGH